MASSKNHRKKTLLLELASFTVLETGHRGANAGAFVGSILPSDPPRRARPVRILNGAFHTTVRTGRVGSRIFFLAKLSFAVVEVARNKFKTIGKCNKQAGE